MTLVTRDGQKIRGVKKNEDPFSIQIMDMRERIQGYLKSDLEQVIFEKTSVMPEYGPERLSQSDLNDLIGYLSTLRGSVDAMRIIMRYITSAVPVVRSCSSFDRAFQGSRVGPPQVTYEDILDGLKDPGKWLTYHGTYDGHRHSPLTQITPANVDQLSAQWTFQTGVLGAFQATPIVIDGVIYVTGFNNNAWAIDARTGRQIWRYRRDLPDQLVLCCGTVNRGFAVLGDRLFMSTADAHLLALDMKTGSIVFDVTLEDYKRGYSATVAPLVVKDNVILGIAGAEYGIRGFIEAFDAKTGKKSGASTPWPVPESSAGIRGPRPTATRAAADRSG